MVPGVAGSEGVLCYISLTVSKCTEIMWPEAEQHCKLIIEAVM